MKDTLVKATEMVVKPERMVYALKNGEQVLLSPVVMYLHQKLGLDSFLSWIIKQQSNQAIRRQIFQIWKISRSKREYVILSLKDRYNEYLVYQEFPDYEKRLPELTFYMVDRVIYIPEELN